MAIPELIYCADGNRRFAELAIEAGFLYGAQLPNTVYFPLHFADQKWRKPNFERYMTALAEQKPVIASVLDWEHWHQWARVMWWAIHAAQYADVVMIIPKIPGSVRFIPRMVAGKPVRLGYSVPTKFGGTAVHPSEFLGWPVHLLGGSPEKQMRMVGKALAFGDDLPRLNVVSVDGNYALKMATRHNQYWTPGTTRYAQNPHWPTLREANDGSNWGDGSAKADAPYEAFRRSCVNIMAAWRKQAG